MSPRKRRRPQRRASAKTLARTASARQRKLYGLRVGAFPDYCRDEVEMDAQYLADLKANPEAALWLSAHNEEVHRGIRVEGESHVLNLSQHRKADAERFRRRQNEDVLSFRSHRGPSLNDLDERAFRAGEESRVLDGDGFLSKHGAERLTFAGEYESRLIDAIDAKRSAAMRRGDDDEQE